MRGLVIALLLSALACGEPSVKGVNVHVPAFEGDGTELEPCSYEPIAEVEILGPHVVDQYLELQVFYGGGCEDHAFKLCWDATFEGASPLPVAHLSLVHENNGDNCEAAIGQRLAFDLSPLADAWLDAPEHQLGPIQLRLDDGFGNTSSTAYDLDGDVTCDPANQDCPAPDLGCLDLGSSPPAVACTQTPRYRRAGDPCNDLDQPLCEPGTVCNQATVGEDCSDPTFADFFPGCCVPACRLDGDSPCPEAGQRCVPFTAEGAAADSGLCTYGT